MWRGQLVPSLAVALSGARDQQMDTFYVDYGIRPETVPQISYVDLLRGRFDQELVRGKRVLIGVTAVELGDVAAVPVWSAIPGSLLQALATESVLQNRDLRRLPDLAVLAETLVMVLVLVPGFRRWSWRKGLTVLGAVSLGLFAVSLAAQAFAPVLLDITPPIVAAMLAFAAGVIRRTDEQSMRLRTQSSALQRQDAIMRRVVDNTFDSLLTIEANGLVISFNPAAERMFGIESDKMIGRSFALLLAESDALGPQYEAPGAFLADLAQRKEPQEVYGRRADGQAFPMDLAVTEINEADERIFIVLARDITEHRRREERLRRARDEADIANRTKTEFLANMSHELRTPLNAVIGFSETMKMELFGQLGHDKYREYAAAIFDSGSHLLQVINDILDLSKIEAGKFELREEEIDVKKTIESAMRLMRERASNADVTISIEVEKDLPAFYADERLVKQMLINLLSNAVKFTKPGGAVCVHSHVEPDGGLCLAVRDTGIGIAEGHLPRVMEPFAQVDGALSRRYEGSGLGLPLVNRFVTLHGGSFTLESKLEVGTHAIARFPAERLMTRRTAASANRMIAA
jgi:PAS domain S-box-containing protein